MQDEILKKITDEFKQIQAVKALVLSGSTTTNYADENSDYDLYIYSDSEVDIEKRRKIAEKFSSDFDINNQFFETGDEWKMPEGQKGIDIMYRSREWIEGQIERVFNRCEASLGYTTCFAYNVNKSVILYDPEGWFAKLQAKTDVYPEKLAQNIIKKNFIMLKDKRGASFLEQVQNAVKRQDFVSVNHRTTAFLASYFDVLFALNRLYHPGEKRLVRFCKDNCNKLPKDFEKDFVSLFPASDPQKVSILDEMVENLRAILYT